MKRRPHIDSISRQRLAEGVPFSCRGTAVGLPRAVTMRGDGTKAYAKRKNFVARHASARYMSRSGVFAANTFGSGLAPWVSSHDDKAKLIEQLEKVLAILRGEAPASPFREK